MVMLHGEPMVLRRTGEADVINLRGKPYRSSETRLGAGSAAQELLRVKIGWYEIEASTWDVKAPRRGDRLEIEREIHRVLDVIPLDDRGAIELYDLSVGG